MKRLLSLLALLIPFFSYSQAKTYDDYVKEYITLYSDIAVKEMLVYKIPASITLAQGIFESNAGRSKLAKDGNNHFGIKCHKEWTGPSLIQDDDVKGECFRKYDNAEASYRDHSYFLTTRDRYKGLFTLEITDYKGWANGLKAAGYATNPEYPEKLIKTIEKFELYKFDRLFETPLAAVGEPVSKDVASMDKKQEFAAFAEGPGGRMVYLNNDLQFVILNENDNAETIAAAFGVSEKKLKKWNDLPSNAEFRKGDMVYLQQKKRRGTDEFHTVTSGETLHSVSQLHGIKMKYLCKKNGLSSFDDIKPGQKLRLK